MAFIVYGNDPEQTTFDGQKCKHIRVNGELAWNNKESLGNLIVTPSFAVTTTEVTRTFESEEFDVTGYETLSGTVVSSAFSNTASNSPTRKTFVTLEVYNAEKSSEAVTKLFNGIWNAANTQQNPKSTFTISVSELSGMAKLKMTLKSSASRNDAITESDKVTNAVLE